LPVAAAAHDWHGGCTLGLSPFDFASALEQENQ
jgi:hypothetical protein